MEEKYICINDVFTIQQKQGFTNLPIKGEEYTLKQIVKSGIDGKEGYIFYELPNPHHPNGQEYSFRPSRFVKRQDDAVLEAKYILKQLIEQD